MLQCMLGASVFLLVCLLELNFPPPPGHKHSDSLELLSD